MKMKKMLGLSCLVFAMSTAYAETTTAPATETQETSNRLISPYGDNPNLFHVFMYKAQDQVVRAGKATERGLAKIGPALDSVFGVSENELPEKPEITHQSLSQPSSSGAHSPAISSNQNATAVTTPEHVTTYPIEEL